MSPRMIPRMMGGMGKSNLTMKKPIKPKNTMTKMSVMLWLKANVPTEQNIKTMGVSTCRGMLEILAKPRIPQ